mmetsp:Transcript_85105/g.214555  ORF Transcript_85105/g.214555 Transcript_85105/m.214555 type:complete len:224 (+) Transcript_85105:662-1333(+)
MPCCGAYWCYRSQDRSWMPCWNRVRRPRWLAKQLSSGASRSSVCTGGRTSAQSSSPRSAAARCLSRLTKRWIHAALLARKPTRSRGNLMAHYEWPSCCANLGVFDREAGKRGQAVTMALLRGPQAARNQQLSSTRWSGLEGIGSCHALPRASGPQRRRLSRAVTLAVWRRAWLRHVPGSSAPSALPRSARQQLTPRISRRSTGRWPLRCREYSRQARWACRSS